MMMSGRNRYPFTANQWEELQIQALIFKYMVSGIPIPPGLVFTIKRSFSYQLQHVGWNCFKGRKLDTELGRCKRTDGKKWRCSKQAYTDSKYCERHMHRGKNRSRKPVETCATTMENTSTVNQSLSLSLSSSDTLRDRHELGSFMYPHASEPSRSFIGSSKDDSWQFTPLKSSSSSSPNHKTTHRFFDEWPPKHRDKSSDYSSSSSWLSISISSTSHDFPIIR